MQHGSWNKNIKTSKLALVLTIDWCFNICFKHMCLGYLLVPMCGQPNASQRAFLGQNKMWVKHCTSLTVSLFQIGVVFSSSVCIQYKHRPKNWGCKLLVTAVTVEYYKNSVYGRSVTGLKYWKLKKFKGVEPSRNRSSLGYWRWRSNWKT